MDDSTAEARDTSRDCDQTQEVTTQTLSEKDREVLSQFFNRHPTHTRKQR